MLKILESKARIINSATGTKLIVCNEPPKEKLKTTEKVNACEFIGTQSKIIVIANNLKIENSNIWIGATPKAIVAKENMKQAFSSNVNLKQFFFKKTTCKLTTKHSKATKPKDRNNIHFLNSKKL